MTSRSRIRRPTALIIASVAALGGAALTSVGLAAPAAADTIGLQPGAYDVTVPANTTAMVVKAGGSSGTSGGAQRLSSGISGRYGVASTVTTTIPVGSGTDVDAGDQLYVVVAAQLPDGSLGSGGSAGHGAEEGRIGGVGGGASYVVDLTNGRTLVVAGGGGGGGGAGGMTKAPGGTGGSNGSGYSGSPTNTSGGAGGSLGDADASCGQYGISNGGAGEDATTFTGAGGGGGGGGGACGGHSGAAGSAGLGGGGGGGAGRSLAVGTGAIGTASGFGPGSMALTFSGVLQITSPTFGGAYTSAGFFGMDVTTNTPATFSLRNAPSWVSINPSTGRLSANFPYGVAGLFRFQIVASDGSSPDAVQDFSLSVYSPPQVTSAQVATAPEGSAFSFPVTTVSYPVVNQFWLTDAPSWLAIDPTTGVLSGTPPTGSTGSYPMTINVGNGADNPGEASFVLTVVPAALTIPATTLPAAFAKQPYSATLTASGGVAPYTWSRVTGTLPPGLTLAPAGTLSGTPSSAGTWRFTVSSTDAQNPAATASRQLALTVRAARPDLSVLTTNPASFVSGQTGRYAVAVSNAGGARSAAVTATSTVPAGLTFVSASGAGWSCTHSGRSFTCHHAALGGGVNAPLAVVTHVAAAPNTVLTTTVRVGPTDAVPANNTSTDRLTVS